MTNIAVLFWCFFELRKGGVLMVEINPSRNKTMWWELAI